VADRIIAALRIAAALVGTLPVAVLAAICVAKYAPLDAEPRFVAGFLLVIPLWVAAICWVFLARGAARAWLACGLAALVLAALVCALPS
jgi:hypothetical protein